MTRISNESLQEDDKLRLLVGRHGSKNWTRIASLLPSKVGKQVCIDFPCTSSIESSISSFSFVVTPDKCRFLENAEFLGMHVCYKRIALGLHWYAISAWDSILCVGFLSHRTRINLLCNTSTMHGTYAGPMCHHVLTPFRCADVATYLHIKVIRVYLI